jgi:hypothetical protein
MRRIFRYLKGLWEDKTGRISLRSVLAMALSIDFIINVHNCSYVVIKVLNMIMTNRVIDAGVIASLSGYLAQTAMILGIEAALIAAMLALKTYQSNIEFTKTQPNETTTTSVEQVKE